MVKSVHQAEREYQLAELRDQERALLSFQEKYGEGGYFEIKLGLIKPSEEIIVELKTVGLAEA